MASDLPGTHPAILELLETVLPDEASALERADFARGLTLLAELLGELDTREGPDTSPSGERQ